MSGDEIFVTVAAAVVGPLAWAWWLWRARSIHGLFPDRSPVAALGAALASATLLILLILRFCAADDVRNAPQYLAMYVLLGLAWLRVTMTMFPLAGLSSRDDLFERRNHAAVTAWIGAMVGLSLCYAGGNIGNGPGWWVVVFSAALASTALALAWLAVGQATGLVELVTVDRDAAAGVRLGCLLVSFGVIFGGAVAGDWVSAASTVADFVARASGALVLIVVAFLAERVMRPTPERWPPPVVRAGVAPGLAYLAVAVAMALAPDWIAR